MCVESVDPAEREIVFYQTTLVPILTVPESRSEAEKEKLDSYQEIVEGPALLVMRIRCEPMHNTVA